MARPDYVPAGAVNIKDHGAVENPTDPDDGSYSDNRQAIIDAANAAGSEGSIYVPEGTYYFAAAGGSNSWIRIGTHTPPGISAYGDGPEKSEIALSSHHGDGAIGTLFDYTEDEYTSTSHTVTWQELRLNGNYPNLPNLKDDNVGSLGINVRSNPAQTLELKRVHIYQTYNAGVRTANGDFTADYCTFEKCGFGVENDSGGDSIDHCSVPSPQSSNSDTAIFRDCEFRLTPGNAIDPGGDGDVEVYRCWGEGLGTGFMKLQDNSFYAENLYARMNTPELESLITDQSRPFDGRLAFYSMDGGVPSVDLYDVKFEEMTEQASYMDTNSWTVGGDIVAFDGVGTKRDLQNYTIKERNGGTYEWSMGSMSIHGINNTFDVFSTSNGGGTIDTLNWESGIPLGTTGSTTITNQTEGGAKLNPSYPDQNEVGYDGTTGGATVPVRAAQTVSGVAQTVSGVAQTTPSVTTTETLLDDFDAYTAGNKLKYEADEWGVEESYVTMYVRSTDVTGGNSAGYGTVDYSGILSSTDASNVTEQSASLPAYPRADCTIRVATRIGETNGWTEMGFAVPSTETDLDNNSYMIRFGDGFAPELVKNVSGTETVLASFTNTLSTGTWYDAAVEFEDTGSEVNLTARLWEWDSTNSVWNEVESKISGTDSNRNFPTDGGIGFGMYLNNYFDKLRFWDGLGKNGEPGYTP